MKRASENHYKQEEHSKRVPSNTIKNLKLNEMKALKINSFKMLLNFSFVILFLSNACATIRCNNNSTCRKIMLKRSQ